MIKKIVFILGLFLSLNKFVFADNLWRDYLEEGVTEYEKETRYKWYKEEVEGEFLEYGNDSSKYRLKSNNPFYGEYTNWSEDCTSGYDIESKKMNSYQKTKPIRYIKLSNFSKPTTVELFGILYSGTPTNTQLIKLKTVSVYPYNVDENSYMIIYLNREYELEDICVRVKMSDSSVWYTITMYEDDELNNVIATYKNYGENVYTTAPANSLNSNSWEDIVYTKEDIEENNYKKVRKNIDVCRYRKKYYYWFDVNRIYFKNDYYKKVDGYIRDQDNYKFFYKYESNIKTKNSIKYIYLDKEKLIYKNNFIYNYLPKEIEKIEYRNTNDNDNKNNYKCSCKFHNCNINNKESNLVFLILIILFSCLVLFIIKLLSKNKKI